MVGVCVHVCRGGIRTCVRVYVCVCGPAAVLVCAGLSSEQSIYSPPEGMAGREGDWRVNCVVESTRGGGGGELSQVN